MNYTIIRNLYILFLNLRLITNINHLDFILDNLDHIIKSQAQNVTRMKSSNFKLSI